jgi:hypothetical protein
VHHDVSRTEGASNQAKPMVHALTVQIHALNDGAQIKLYNGAQIKP